jgi:hypothetical protein
MTERSKKNHALNLFISYEEKKALQDIAELCDTTLAAVVRLTLKLGIPILKGLHNSQEVLLSEQVDLVRRLRLPPER